MWASGPGPSERLNWLYARSLNRRHPLADTTELLRLAGGAGRLRAVVERGLGELAA